jgi:hypothetical protein
MTSAHQVRPEQVGGLLEPGEHGVAAAHVLIKAQLATRPQDPAELGERSGDIGHRAQHARDDNRVEFRVSGGKPRSGAVDHPDRDGGVRGRLPGTAAQKRFGFDSDDLMHRGGIMLEIQAGARADLHDPAGQPGEQLAPELTVTAIFVTPAAPVKVTGKQWVIHQRHTQLVTTGHPRDAPKADRSVTG